jgi:hypothetical protein
VFFLFLFALIAYAPKIQIFGYYNDDWWQIYGGENFGIQRFPEMYASDRPALAYWHAFLFSIFGSQILPYQILALGIRLLGSIGLFWALTLVWKKRIIEVILMSILFLVYPGFLEQPNGFDYQTHQVAITSFVFSIGFSILSINSKFIGRKILFFLISSSLSIIIFFFMEYYVGLEIYRWLLIGCIYLRENLKINRKIVFQYILKVIPYSFSMFFFVFWRIFLFESTRYATDVNRIKIELLSSPFLSFFNIGRRWISDIGDIFFKVWSKQGYKNVFELRSSDLVIAFLLGFIAIGPLFLLIKFFENNLVIKRDEINQDDNKKTIGQRRQCLLVL